MNINSRQTNEVEVMLKEHLIDFLNWGYPFWSWDMSFALSSKTFEPKYNVATWEEIKRVIPKEE